MTFLDTEMKELGRSIQINAHNIRLLIRTPHVCLRHLTDGKSTHTHTHTHTHSHTNTHTHIFISNTFICSTFISNKRKAKISKKLSKSYTTPRD